VAHLPARSHKPTPLLLVGLLGAAIALAGCLPGRSDEPAPPAPQAPAPQPTNLASPGCSPTLGDVQADEGFKRFDVTPQQLAVIQGRLIEVLCRQGLWDQGVRFGMNFNTDRTRFWVLIHPGRSGLTPQQVLNRLLGRP
jgi:hypothetical protein